MCPYDTHAAIPAITAVAVYRTAASHRRPTGTREINSIVASNASGGHAAIVWLIGLSWACSTFATVEATTPSVSVARTPHRIRRCCARAAERFATLAGVTS